MDAVDVIRGMYAAWNRGEVETALAMVHPEVVWRSSGQFPGMEPVYHGHEGVLRFERDLRTPFSTFHITVERIHQAGSEVVATLRFDAVGAESGAAVQVWFENVWDIRDGLVISFRSRPVG